MNQNLNENLHPLLGRWNVEHRFALMLQDGILFTEKKYIWDFHPDGTLIEQLPHHMPTETNYRYDPESMLLSIDRPFYNDDADVDPARLGKLSLKDRYRVAFPLDDRCILTMLDGNGTEPLNCSIRLLMKRMGSGR